MRSRSPTPAPSQLTLNFEPGLVDDFPTLREFLADRVTKQIDEKSGRIKPQKTVAMDMDLAPSTLSRKLAPAEGDTQRFNIDDLELFIQKTGDASAIEYLAAKYLHSDDHRAARLVARVEQQLQEMMRSLAALKGAA